MLQLGSVAECASTALHTETVLYVVQRYAQQRSAASARQQRDEEEYSGDGEGSDNSALVYSSGDVVYHTLENMGVHTGLRLAERLLCREPLTSFAPDVVARFVAGPVWLAIFGKVLEITPSGDADIVELTDRRFAWIKACSFRAFDSSATNTTHTVPGYTAEGTTGGESNGKDRTDNARPEDSEGPADFVVYACGILRGVLQTLGHPHTAVGFQVMATAPPPPQPLQGDYGVNGASPSGLLNLSEVRFSLDFRGERTLLGR